MISMLLSMTHECVVLLCMSRNTAQSLPVHSFCFSSSRAVLFHLYLHSLFLFCTILNKFQTYFALKSQCISLKENSLIFYIISHNIWFFKNIFKYSVVLSCFFFFFKKALFESVYLFDANKIEILWLIEMSFRPLSIYRFSVHLPPSTLFVKEIELLII